MPPVDTFYCVLFYFIYYYILHFVPLITKLYENQRLFTYHSVFLIMLYITMAWSTLQYVDHTRIIHLDRWTVLLVNRDVV